MAAFLWVANETCGIPWALTRVRSQQGGPLLPTIAMWAGYALVYGLAVRHSGPIRPGEWAKWLGLFLLASIPVYLLSGIGFMLFWRVGLVSWAGLMLVVVTWTALGFTGIEVLIMARRNRSDG